MVEALGLFLKQSQIEYLTVYGRVKDFESFAEKCERKSYDDPFVQNEDFVGIRIIVYFPDDIEKVCDLIENEFDVSKNENKSTELEVDRFGYRSQHLIVKIKESWLASPNYRDLNGICAEIQVRTVLMHAWAEVEHKLQYKSSVSIPSNLRRKSFLLSAKFEDADQQFQDLRDQISNYKNEVKEGG